jgi:nucleotide-binding universal stress UspA family protein
MTSTVSMEPLAAPSPVPYLTPSARRHTFASVLLATDFSPASREAFRTALDLCRLLGSRLTLLHVFEYSDAGTYQDFPAPACPPPAELPSLMQDARTHLCDLRRQAINAGLQCDTSMQGGAPADTIQQFIRSQHIDLVVMGTSALHGFERLVFGSTAEALMRNSPIPVLVVGPRADAGAVAHHDRPVVFATDFNPRTVAAASLAAGVAAATLSTLHCLHVLPRSIENTSGASALPEILLDALRQMSARCGVAAPATVCATTFSSQVSTAVTDYARAHHAKLIVLGVRQASLASTHTPAHIAYRIVTEATCPVLTLTFDASPENHLAAATCLGIA